MSRMKFRPVIESSNLSLEEIEARHELWRQGDLSWKLKGKQENIYNDIVDQDKDVSVVLCSRRFGKCVTKGTQVPTVNRGFVEIQDLKIGDMIFGYNKDGTVSPTMVKDVIYQGKKEVVDLINNGKKVISCTQDHKFLTKYCRGKATKKYEWIKELSVKEFLPTSKIMREFVEIDNKGKDIPSVYALGALIGDGCSRQGSKSRIDISSADVNIVENVSRVINAERFYKNSEKNYTWRIKLNNKYEVPEFYDEWVRGRYAHEKIAKWEEVSTWNRTSKLKFLAGLIDTDGSIRVASNILTITFGMQAKSVVEVFKKLIKELWFYDVTICEDNREKYKNGSVFSVNIRNNLISKRIVKELDTYLVCPRKKWKESYSDLPENNTREECIGVQITNSRVEDTYDIEVDNDTHLYLIENGLITHNSTTALVPAIEVCIQNPNAIVKYACPTQKMVKKMIYPALKVLFHDAPPEFNLESLWKETDGELKFPNGSILTIAGTDGNNADNLRGAYAHLVIADEAGFMDDLDYVIKSVLLPQTDTTGGKLILLSTPNYYNVAHEFHTQYVKPFEVTGKLIKFTLFDSPMVDDNERQKIINRYSKKLDDPKFKCEYMVEIPTSTEDTVIPEFYENRKESLFTEHEEPEMCDYYVGGDIGTNDPTGFVFGYYNFIESTIYITDEWISEGAGKELSTSMIAEGIRLKEETNFKRPPTKRVIDNNNQILVTDLKKDYNLPFSLTKKDNKMAQVNKVRDLIGEGRIKISTNCKNLIYQLTSGQWKKSSNKSEFEHLEESIDGELVASHLDLLDSLIYMVRNINLNKNPKDNNDTVEITTKFGYTRKESKRKQLMNKIFNRKQ